KAEPLAVAGAHVAESPTDVARRVEAVITMVADPQALADVTEGPNGVAAGVGEGTTVIQMSTVGPNSTARLASLLAEDALLDSPVLGSISEVESGTLNVFVGGQPELVETLAPAALDARHRPPRRSGRRGDGGQARRQHDARRRDRRSRRSARGRRRARPLAHDDFRGAGEDAARRTGRTAATGDRDRRLPDTV